jgi:Co/Zn/Cd efflux system component
MNEIEPDLIQQNDFTFDTHEHDEKGSRHDHIHDTNGHGHHHMAIDEETSGGRLLVTLVLNLIIPVAQVIGGIMANSMALVSDAVHNFSDFTAILISCTPGTWGRPTSPFPVTW